MWQDIVAERLYAGLLSYGTSFCPGPVAGLLIDTLALRRFFRYSGFSAGSLIVLQVPTVFENYVTDCRVCLALPHAVMRPFLTAFPPSRWTENLFSSLCGTLQVRKTTRFVIAPQKVVWISDIRLQRLRPLAYAKAHVILIGYSVDNPDSLDNVTNKVWVGVPSSRMCLTVCSGWRKRKNGAPAFL